MTPEEEAALQRDYYAQHVVPATPAAPAPDAPPMYDYWAGQRDVSAPAPPPPPAPAGFFERGYAEQKALEPAEPAPYRSPLDSSRDRVGKPRDIGEGVSDPPGAPPPEQGPALGPVQTPIGPPRTLEPDKTAGATDGSSRAASYYGGGSSGPSEYSRAVAGLRGTYDVDKGATQAQADAERARADAVAVGSAALAQQKIDDQEIQQMEAQNAAKTFADYSAETQRQIDDVRAKRIDTGRAYGGEGGAIAAAIGGALGGLYQGLNKLEKNPFIEQMNKTIDRDIAAQEHDIRTQKEGIGERKGLLREMQATYKDEALAKAQARNLYYEGAKEAIAAQAATFDSPTIQARADQAISALTREQSKIDIQEAMRKAAAAQAAASAAEARRRWELEYRLKLDEHTRKWAETGIEAEKKLGERADKDAVRFVGTGKDEKGNPTGHLAADADDRKEQVKARKAGERLIQKIDEVLAIRAEQGTGGRFAEQAVHGIYNTKANNRLKVLKSDLITDAGQAKGLGALSESDRQLLDDQYSDLNTVGSSADERLIQIRSTLRAGLDRDAEQSSGARAVKATQGGRERVEITGGYRAPINPIVTPRAPPK